MAKSAPPTEPEFGQYLVPTDTINLGIGQPANEKLPLNILRKAWAQLAQTFEKKEACQYGAIRGYPQFLKSLSVFLTEEYAQRVDTEDLFVTNGITQMVEMLYKLFGGKKTKIFVEDPTYFIVLDIFRDFNYEAEFVLLPMEKDGVDLDVLEFEMNRLESDEMAFFYTIPVFHNPTGVTLSHEKRMRLAELAERYGDQLLVVADEVYQMLYFDPKDVPPMPLCYYSNQIVSLGTFSKIFAPAARLGWMQTKNKKVMDRVVGSGMMDSSGGLAPLMALQVEMALKDGSLREYINYCRQFLKEGRDALCSSLELGSIGHYTIPKGGYFLWIEFPESVKTKELLTKSLEGGYRVKFHNGDKFSAGGRCQNALRLSFSCYNPSELVTGGQRLSALVQETIGAHLPKEIVETRDQLQIHLLGFRGRLGRKLQEQLDKHQIPWRGVERDLEMIPSETAMNLVLDVSSPEGTAAILERLRNHGWNWPVIVGTTGQLPVKALELHAKKAPVLVASNFSYGIPMVSRWLQGVDQGVWTAKIHETHHTRKADKISGTALRLQQQFEKPEHVDLSSSREGEIFGIHATTMETPDEKIEIIHTAKNRDIFAVGTLRYFDWIVKQAPGLYTELDYLHRQDHISYDKYSGSGNDFIVVKGTDLPSQDPTDWSKMAIQWCRRGLDIGADGLIVVMPSDILGITLRWWYFNSDGSLVEMCGNGSRCVAHWANENLGVPSGTLINNFDFRQGYKVEGQRVSIRMPTPFLDHDIAHYRGRDYSRITVGVPHLVTSVAAITTFDDMVMESISDEMKRSGVLMNLNWVQPTMMNSAKSPILIKTYERGSGHTLACGTGCCAAALHLCRNELASLVPGSQRSFYFQTESEELLEVTLQKEETREGEKLLCQLSGPVRRVVSGKIEL